MEKHKKVIDEYNFIKSMISVPDMNEFIEHKLEKTNLPKDVFLGAMNLYMIGKYEIQIENYMSIIEYTKEVIKIRGKGNNARIIGKNLNVFEYTKNCMTVRGIIKEVHLY